ncbi:MAG: HAD family acid phosphatase [bacterium]
MPKQEIVICDIDGCLIDTSWIFDHTEEMEINQKWDFFNRNANNHDNKINFDLVALIDKLKFFAGYKIFFVTSRSDIIYKDTLRMLKRLFSHEDIVLLMRSEGDISPSHEIKEKILSDLKEKYKIICAIDDEPNNCKMFKDNGILTMQIV